MTVSVVCGLGFGDEGKGVVTQYLCSQDPQHSLVVRFSGGHQCGHKVMNEKVEHICSNFGAGVLLGCPTYWSEYCTFEPVGFIREYGILKAKGISPKIFLHSTCPVVTPYDIHANRNGIERQHGTTGTGFGCTKRRHFDGLQFSVSELKGCSNGYLSNRLREIQTFYNSPDLDPSEFLEYRNVFCSLISEGIVTIVSAAPLYGTLIFEGNQGLMLDPSIGYMPYCTPSDCTPRNVLEMGYNIDEVYLVSRCYQTRHGNGPMTNEGYPLELVNTQCETNLHNEFQGEFRTTVLDLNQLIHAKTKGIDEVIESGTKVNLVLTCTDQMKDYIFSRNKMLSHYGSDIDSFARAIVSALKINGDVYINTSPYSKTIRKVNVGCSEVYTPTHGSERSTQVHP